MLRVLGANGPIEHALKRAVPVFIGEDSKLLMVGVDNLDANETEVVSWLNEEAPVIFYGFDSPGRFIFSGNKAVPYSFLKNAGYVHLPANWTEIAKLYEEIVAGKKVENKAMVLAGNAGTKKNIARFLHHDLYPGKSNHVHALERAKNELGITGDAQEVRAKLEALFKKDTRSTVIAELAQGEMLPGVFCDIEGTLLAGNDEVNPLVAEKLEKFSADRAITLWTGGDVERIQKLLAKHSFRKFPLVSKYDFFGCKVQTVLDDLPAEEFEKEYGITCQEYLRVE